MTLTASVSCRWQRNVIRGRKQWNIKKEKGVFPLFIDTELFLCPGAAYKNIKTTLRFFYVPW